MPQFDASTAVCTVDAYKEGLLSAAGHDVRLSVDRFNVAVDEDSLEASFDATSLRAVVAMRDGQPHEGALSDSDLTTIDGYVQKDILNTKVHPTIRFTSDDIDVDDDEAEIDGTLELNGRMKTLVIVARVQGDHWVARIPIHQPDFGIRPFKALMGALRIKPTIDIELRLPRKEMPF